MSLAKQYSPRRRFTATTTRCGASARDFEAGFAVEVPGDIQRGAIFRADPSRYSTDRPSMVELYDLDADPLEQRNLAGTQGAGAIERELGAELWRWMRETGDPLLKGPIASPRYRLAMES